MNRIFYSNLLLLLFLAGGFGANPAHAQSSKQIVRVPISDAPSYAKRALVVGVTDYALAPPLHVCANDAREFADLLRTKFGFSDVTLMTDDPATPLALRPTCANLRRAIHGLLKGIVPGKSEVVLFYSGHGVRLSTDSDWLVPEDGDPNDIAHSCVNYTAIVQALNTARPKRAFLVTDACRSLLAGKGTGGSGFGKGLEGLNLGPEVAEILSCQPTEVSQEGLPTDFPESVFTHFLVKGLEGDPDALAEGTKNVTFDSLMEYVQGHVSSYVSSRFNASQIPDGRATLGRMVLARAGGTERSASVGSGPIEETLPPKPVSLPKANARLAAVWTNADGKFDPAIANAMTMPAVQQALDAGADVNVVQDGWTALTVAANLGHADVARLLLDKGADVNEKRGAGWFPLMDAAWEDHADIVRMLLDKGVAINAKTDDGATALMGAAHDGCTDVVKLLLDRGADIAIKNNDGKTALNIATEEKHADSITLLQAASSTSPAPAPQLTPAQHQASERLVALFSNADGRGDQEKARAMTVTAVQQALDAGADINARIDGTPILTTAAGFSPIAVVRLLLDKGAIVNASDIPPSASLGGTALDNSVLNHDPNVARLLLEKGADINARNNDGATAVMGAARYNNVAVVRIFLDNGADIDAKRNDGMTALKDAIVTKHDDIAALLKAAGEKE